MLWLYLCRSCVMHNQYIEYKIYNIYIYMITMVGTPPWPHSHWQAGHLPTGVGARRLGEEVGLTVWLILTFWGRLSCWGLKWSYDMAKNRGKGQAADGV